MAGPWWRGSRGEWFVVVQVLLMALVILGPRHWQAGPSWAWSVRPAALAWGLPLMAAGGLLLAASLLKLGSNLSPLPHPKARATLVATGPYRLVRHPIYSGAILLAFGWAVLVQGGLTLASAALLAVFFDLKSRREERWLAAAFPDYAGYRLRVRRFIPFLY